jgi:hypothetical protein
MTSDGSISWVIAATIALLSLDLSAAQAGANWLRLCRLRAPFVPGPAHMKRYRLSRRQARHGADSRFSTVKEQQDGTASSP